MKKTNFEFMISFNQTTFSGTYRRVWEKDGRFFVKVNGECIDVTKFEKDFIKD